MPHSTPLKGEEGFSLIELLAALSILLIGILGVAATLDQTRNAVTTSEVREAAVHRAEREIERLRALPYDQLALASVPTASADQSDPDFYVQGSQYQWDPADATRIAPFVTGGTISPRRPWPDDNNDGVADGDDRLRGMVHVYVTNFVDTVPGVPQAKRVIVGVTVDGPWKLSRPTIVSTVVHQPPAPTP